MALGINILLELVLEPALGVPALVEGLADRELSEPEGAGFDLRIGKLYELKSPGHLGIEPRDTSHVGEAIANYVEGEPRTVTIPRGAYYLVKTIERVNMPENIQAWVSVRTTLFRCGVCLFTAKVNPGYRGELTFGLHNAGPFDFTLEMGARIAHISFEDIQGDAIPYRGQWQDGRVSSEGVEKQT